MSRVRFGGARLRAVSCSLAVDSVPPKLKNNVGESDEAMGPESKTSTAIVRPCMGVPRSFFAAQLVAMRGC